MAATVHAYDCASGELVVRELTPDEQAVYDAVTAETERVVAAAAWEAVAAERDLRIQGSDWIIDPPSDIPPGTNDEIVHYRKEWEDYRAAVRAVTEQTDPLAIDWPTPPPAPSLPLTAQPDGAALLAKLLAP